MAMVILDWSDVDGGFALELASTAERHGVECFIVGNRETDWHRSASMDHVDRVGHKRVADWVLHNTSGHDHLEVVLLGVEGGPERETLETRRERRSAGRTVDVGSGEAARLVSALGRQNRRQTQVVVPRWARSMSGGGTRLALQPNATMATAETCLSVYWRLSVEVEERRHARSNARGAGEVVFGIPQSDITLEGTIAEVYTTLARGEIDGESGVIAQHALDAARRGHRTSLGRGQRCLSCTAAEAWHFEDEHPDTSTRRLDDGPLSKAKLTEVRFTQCGTSEGFMRKAASCVGTAYGFHRACGLRVCSSGGWWCGNLTVPPAGDSGPGRHLWVIGGSRSLSGVGRHALFADYKNHVPQLYYADLAATIASREGEEFSNGKIWLSVCAGYHSDRLAAIMAGYRYVPIDILAVATGFQGEEPNWVVDMTRNDLYDALVNILGGEDELLSIGVVHAHVPCETNSPLNRGMHRDRDGLAISDRAVEVDRINANLLTFLRRFCCLRRRRADAACTCGRRRG